MKVVEKDCCALQGSRIKHTSLFPINERVIEMISGCD